jgi:hypothetical protein
MMFRSEVVRSYKDDDPVGLAVMEAESEEQCIASECPRV